MSIGQKQRRILYVSMSVITLLIGFGLGLAFSSSIEVDSKLSIDTLVTGLIALFALGAATFLLPLAIQPLLQKQNGMNYVAQQDIKSVLREIDALNVLCFEIYTSGRTVTQKQRKIILERHTKILSIANILVIQSSKIESLSKFKTDVYDPLSDNKSSIAEKVYPGVKITEKLYLELKGELDAVSYKLIAMRYELN